MRSAFCRIDVVAESIDICLIAIVVLYSHFRLNALLMTFTVDNIFMNHRTMLVQVFYVFLQTSFIEEGMIFCDSSSSRSSLKFQTDSFIQEGKLSQTVTQGFMIIDGCFRKD